jgi:hypothetical protein
MGRRQQIATDSDGAATLRLRLPPHTWRLITRYADRVEIPPEAAARIFLEQIEALIGDNDAPWLSGDWRHVLQASQRDTPPSLEGIDLEVLHRSDKTKSGFVGVYANGAGFRAAGRGGAYLGTFKTAEEAAWARYKLYKRANLPYGELELEIDRLRARGEKGDDEQLKAIALETAYHLGALHLYPGYEDYHPGQHVGPRPAPKPLGFDAGGLEAASAALHAADEADERPRAGRSLIRRRSTDQPEHAVADAEQDPRAADADPDLRPGR